MVLLPLLPVEKDSISNAIEFIRAAGWKDKADKLKTALDSGKISIDLDLPMTVGASTTFGGTVRINPSVIMSEGTDPPKPLDRYDLYYTKLAAILLHEADHLLLYGEIEAYGEQISFLEGLNENFKKYFPDATAKFKADLEEWKKAEEERLKRLREKYITDPGWEKR